MTTTPETIVIFSPGYASLTGGAERQAQLLAERWASQGKPVWVITTEPQTASTANVINGVRIVRFSLPSVPGLSVLVFAVKIFGFLRREKAHIRGFIVCMFNTFALVCALCSATFRVPCLIRPSAGGPDGNLDKILRTFLGGLKTALTLSRVSYLVAINDQIKKEFQECGLTPRVIPNGIDTTLFNVPSAQTRAQLRGRLGLRTDETAVLFVGRLDPVKNLDFILSAWPDLVKQHPKARLLLAGDGPEKTRLEDSARKASMLHIRFLGGVADPRELYQACDIFLLPSFREGMSNALLEALACGLPAVVSDIAGNRAVVEEKVSGLFWKPGDASDWQRQLGSLIANPDLRLSMGRRAREQIERRFGVSVITNGYETLMDAAQRAYFQQRFPILAYHRVCTPPQYGIDLSVEQFERQMQWLKADGYSSFTLAEFFDYWKNNRPFPPKKVVITFDDGHRDTFETARPILEKYGFRATLFLNSGLLGQRFWVGGRRPAPVTWHDVKPAEFNPASPEWRVYEFMSWDQAKELADAGMEIGSHAVTHPFLTQLTDADLSQQLLTSKKDLENRLGKPVQFLCYPSGDYDARVQQAARDAGYDGAVVSASHYEFGARWDDPFAWERIGLWRDVSFWKFKALVQGWYSRAYMLLPSSVWKAGQKIYRSFR